MSTDPWKIFPAKGWKWTKTTLSCEEGVCKMECDFLPDAWGLNRLVHGDKRESSGACAAKLPIPHVRAAASGRRGTRYGRLCKGARKREKNS